MSISSVIQSATHEPALTQGPILYTNDIERLTDLFLLLIRIDQKNKQKEVNKDENKRTHRR